MAGVTTGARPDDARARPETAPRATTDHPRLRAPPRQLTTTDGSPGVVAVRDRSGRAVLTSGVADVQRHTPLRADSRFRIGSMTKPLGEGRVVLDAPVERHLPGAEVRYSNTGYLLAGLLVERVTGHTYADEIRRRVIAPLHLRRTSLPGDATGVRACTHAVTCGRARASCSRTSPR
ncbi:serine hydrolase domain-containing protein [Streptomyces sp. NPDC048518]|uniref:serine hydrolase domain-containing protein n=1 Tax=Streptomyces sp. NPDC048518 TaxID=3155029 RepID=UPI0033E51717